MNTTEIFFLQAVNAFAKESSVTTPEDKVNKEELYSLAKRHGMQGILYCVCEKQGLFKSQPIMAKLQQDYEKAVSYMALRRTKAEILSQRLSALKLPHIEFKGSAVADYYPIPELRLYSDVDMIVKPQDKARLREFMEQDGFDYTMADEGIVSCFKKGYELYEMHTSLNLPESEGSLNDDIWAEAIPCTDGFSMRFEDNFHLAYLISHMEKHMKAGGAGVKMYLDIALYMTNCKNLDLEKVCHILEGAGLRKYFETVLYLCHKWFNTTLPDFAEPLSPEIYQKLCETTLTGGIYGDHSREGNLNSALAREIKSKKQGAKFRFIMSRVFPPKTELYRLYPKYEGKAFFIPFAWFKHTLTFANKNKLKKVRQVADTDLKSAEKQQDFLKSIGCK